MPRPNDIYYDNYQLPIFLTLTVILWMVVSVRLWAFRKHYPRWRSWRGLSMIFAELAAALCTVYFGMLVALHFLNERIIRIRDVLRPHERTHGQERLPENYSDAEVQTVMDTAQEIYGVRLPPSRSLPLFFAAKIWLYTTVAIVATTDTRYSPLVDKTRIRSVLSRDSWSAEQSLAWGAVLHRCRCRDNVNRGHLGDLQGHHSAVDPPQGG